ncbi:hypothetical protein E4U17_005047 [Claviceps sp. LM77 group G4]|nr:hypothetical protein E4U17_005047 [Claviceps sp. LM77 group G4]
MAFRITSDKHPLDGSGVDKFDNKLIKLHELDQGWVPLESGKGLARLHPPDKKRIPRSRDFSIRTCDSKGWSMRNLGHHHVVKLGTA